jgi:membrane associated rhomboid family serine protease
VPQISIPFSSAIQRAPSPCAPAHPQRCRRSPGHDRSEKGEGAFAVAIHYPSDSLTPGSCALTLETMAQYPRYPRSYGSRISWGGMLTPAIRNIIIVCTGVFLVQTLFNLFSPAAAFWFEKVFGLVPLAVIPGLRIWQPVTYLFLHGGILHLLFNMLFLWMFGSDLERTWGTHKFYVYFFVTGIGAGCINVLVKTLLHAFGVETSLTTATIGASGAIYGVLLAAAIMFPDRQIWLIPFPVQIPMRIYVAGAIAIEFFSTLGIGGDNVSHVTHLGGALVGYLYLRRGLFLYRVRNDYLDWKRRRAKKKFEVYMRDHKNDPPGSSDDRWVN